MSDVTEFDWLDPTEVHLVGAAANDFTPLVAKAAAEKKGKKHMSKQKATGEDVYKAYMGVFDRRVDDAREYLARSGESDLRKARTELETALYQRTLLKMTFAENARQAHPERHRTHMGPNYACIITNRRALPADSSIHGWPA